MDGEENFIYNCIDPITDTFLSRSREQRRTERAKFTFSARIRSRRVSSLRAFPTKEALECARFPRQWRGHPAERSLGGPILSKFGPRSIIDG